MGSLVVEGTTGWCVELDSVLCCFISLDWSVLFDSVFARFLTPSLQRSQCCNFCDTCLSPSHNRTAKAIREHLGFGKKL